MICAALLLASAAVDAQIYTSTQKQTNPTYQSPLSTSIAPATSYRSAHSAALQNTISPISGTLSEAPAVIGSVYTSTSPYSSNITPVGDEGRAASGPLRIAPGNGNAQGEAALPIGDAVLPLLLMAAAYACFLLRRRTAEAGRAAE